MRVISNDEMQFINGASMEAVLQPLPGTNGQSTRDAPFVPGKPGYKENDVPGIAPSTRDAPFISGKPWTKENDIPGL